MKNKKKHIDIYPTVYCIDLVVANKEVTIEDIQKQYTYWDGKPVEDEQYSIACTIYCKNKKTNRDAIIVWHKGYSKAKDINKKLDLINSAAHEAFHFVNNICYSIQESIDNTKNNESLAWLQGWATECIYKTWTKR